ncbi:asparagine synthase (glutamine-hydrolyzing) [uncultured Desulfobacter sp.]|uniref:asparagine synthase (glutamine-hydrolyzing) n=1 Tax=uncultured Desulfobacter sp. TaxID=240139 RepID=UPI002AAC2232|nr:asparagine synthase (glutamine-hydrolyzing) [uncultured Desulfobacter sp.]
MCGIAGFISQNLNYDKESIVSGMLKKLEHRGPDQKGVGVFGGVALGMVRLSIIDTEYHEIPYISSDNEHAIVYNGEIYNHEGIRASLRSQYDFKTGSDGETALANYICRGEKALGDFNGMYAFAVYSKRDHQTIIVRDKIGEKPLYYTRGKDFFAFASEIKALLDLVPAVFNDAALSYRAYEFTVGKETLFKGIYSLEPGEYLTIKDEGTVTSHSYWKIWDNLIEIEDDETKILNHLSELLEDCILLRTKNSAHQYGAFVSGGVDSALVACIAKPDFIYTAHYDYDDFDELDYAKLVARCIDRELVIVRPDKQDFINTREKIAWYLDSPCTWTSFTLWELVKKAADENVKVILSGDGADEIFGGYHRYHLLHHDEQIHRLEAMQKYSYMINRYYGSPVERYTKLINRCDNIYDEQVNQYLHDSLTYYFERINADVIHLMGLTDFYTTMQVLLQMADRINMAHHIENRSPFLDFRLVQFAFSLPSKYKIKDGVTKWLLKEVSKKFIPKEIPERIDKRGFSAPVNKWFSWEKQGKYNRKAYRDMVFGDWKKVFNVQGCSV